MKILLPLLLEAVVLLQWFVVVTSYAGKFFFHMPNPAPRPELILITGCTGAGKSTIGMTLALNQGILRCISTDTVRQVMRTFNNDPAVRRSSYAGVGDPVVQWKECCHAIQEGIDTLVDDGITRGVSIVMEGVHLIPSSRLIDRWRASGGIAIGVVLVVSDAEAHRKLIFHRGEITRRGAAQQIKSFERIRAIQDEMIRLGKENGWLQVEQKLEPDPIDMINRMLDETTS